MEICSAWPCEEVVTRRWLIFEWGRKKMKGFLRPGSNASSSSSGLHLISTDRAVWSRLREAVEMLSARKRNGKGCNEKVAKVWLVFVEKYVSKMCVYVATCCSGWGRLQIVYKVKNRWKKAGMMNMHVYGSKSFLTETFKLNSALVNVVLWFSHHDESKCLLWGR